MGENNKRARAGIRRDNVVQKIWKDLGGGRPRRGTVYGNREVWRIQNTSERKNRKKRKKGYEALRNQVCEEEKHLRDIRGVEGRYWNENLSARPNGLRKKAESAISCRGTEPARRKQEMYQ